jgi:hypothetical protein
VADEGLGLCEVAELKESRGGQGSLGSGVDFAREGDSREMSEGW